jgi:hypothetical protein
MATSSSSRCRPTASSRGSASDDDDGGDEGEEDEEKEEENDDDNAEDEPEQEAVAAADIMQPATASPKMKSCAQPAARTTPNCSLLFLCFDCT